MADRDRSPALPPEVQAQIRALDPLELRQLLRQLLDLATPARPLSPARPGPAAVLRLRVDLVGAKPPVWRRVEVPSTLHLDELHGLLQLLLGWTGSHVHRFALGESVWSDDGELFLCPPRRRRGGGRRDARARGPA